MFKVITSYGKWALLLGLLGVLAWWVVMRELQVRAQVGARYFLVFGSSFAGIDEAIAEAQFQVDQSANAGCEAISVGTGGRAGGEVGQAVDVVVLMRC